MIDSSYLCQWCGKMVQIAIDPAGGRTQKLIEDCEMCCRPNVLTVTLSPDAHDATIDSRREND